MSTHNPDPYTYWKKLLGVELPEEAMKYFRNRDEPDFILWTFRRINIPVIMEAETPVVIRHNDPEEIFSLEIGDIPVVAILGTKISGELRRVTQKILRDIFKEYKNEVNKAVTEYLPDEPYGDVYDCTIHVEAKSTTSTRTGKEKITRELVVPHFCKRCPACSLFGYAVTEESDANAISRVFKDTFYSVQRLNNVRIEVTRNTVSQITYTTGQSLYEVNPAKPSTLFVGVLSLKDVTIWETMLLLKAITEMENVGGIKTIFGAVKTHIPAINFRHGRAATGYEIVQKVLGTKKDPKIDDVVDTIHKILDKRGEITLKGEFAEHIRSVRINEIKDIVLEAWKDAAKRRRDVLSIIKKK